MSEDHRTPQQPDIPEFERLLVTLKGSKPAIWREVLVPENATFEDLHLTLQVAFGWRDYHLHMFDAGFTVGPEKLNDAPMGTPVAMDERLTYLYDLPSDYRKFSYDYDLGDDWEHVIERLGKVRSDGRERRPYVIGGQNAGPTEDIGGIRMWNDLAARFRSGYGTAEDEEWLDTTGYGPDYDVDAFDPAEADARLARIDFDIPGTWEAQYHRRASVRVSAPFLTDRSNVIHDLDADVSDRPGM